MGRARHLPGALAALLWLLWTLSPPVVADTSVDAFLARAFPGGVPAPRVLWVTRDLQARIRPILGHNLGALRVRYWARGGRSAWILDEIGKERPITTGIVLDHGRIDRVQVLTFRESRGGEVRYPFFTDQFHGARLAADERLNKPIDGISGATLSVHAVTRVARLALLLAQQLPATLAAGN